MSENMMQDVQNRIDERGIAIQKVGVKDVHLPFLIKTKEGGFQQVLAEVAFSVMLPMEYKGTHMSRFLEILQPWTRKPLAEEELDAMLEEALQRLDAKEANIHLRFKYFVSKSAPMSGRGSVLDLDCFFEGRKEKGQALHFRLGVATPFTSLCPCSKEISAFGAHNQRSICKTVVEYHAGYDCIFIEDLSTLVEQQGSCPIYPLLKRADEKYVTEQAYKNPKFVEDILRDVVLALRKLEGIKCFYVECENFESIHNHSAYAAHEETIT